MNILFWEISIFLPGFSSNILNSGLGFLSLFFSVGLEVRDFAFQCLILYLFTFLDSCETFFHFGKIEEIFLFFHDFCNIFQLQVMVLSSFCFSLALLNEKVGASLQFDVETLKPVNYFFFLFLLLSRQDSLFTCKRLELFQIGLIRQSLFPLVVLYLFFF